METILSTKNEKVKFWKSLFSPKGRREAGLCLVEGENMVKDLDKSLVDALIFEEGKQIPILDKFKCEVYTVSRAVSETISQTVNTSGIFALVKTNFKAKKSDGFAVILDGIKDPSNFGGILRTCAALDVTEIYALDCVDRFNDKVIRASMGGVFTTNVQSIEGEFSSSKCGLSDYQIYALDMGGESVFTTSKATGGGKIALCVGSEAHGLSVGVKKAASKIISLPMKGKMESLNAAVAFAVAAYWLVANDE